MTISGFTIIRNAIDYDFPVIESICSILPLVDEMIIVLGDSSDSTEELINSIKTDKFKIIKSNWDLSKYNKNGQVYANQTDIALKACKGDWCIYIQADEVLHQYAIPIIKQACQKYLENYTIDGFLLRYEHIYADYKHYIQSKHFAYPKEIRIVRNMPDVHSWRDAQSFRIMPNFDYKDYCRKKNTRVLNCILLKDAYMFHYGWSRDPRKMLKKKEEQDSVYSGEKVVFSAKYHDYGNVSCMPLYNKSQPKLMEQRIKDMDWSNLLRYSGAKPKIKKVFAPKYRLLSFIESFLPNGNRIMGFKNYKQLGKF